ncbi:E3 ubiquitin-protein ligase RMND5A-like isoform X2 [Lineus longissimus]|uniref:E3 ubiquitin-protein ligase RMND5A-like isoform X2 n=1 Tax=Lineus longissimus TaxID=88925 RepID=UPI002B4C8FDC
MEACLAVQREVEKILTKFRSIDEHTQRTLGQLISDVQSIRDELSGVPENAELPATQVILLTQLSKRVKEIAGRIGLEHKDLHSSVSKVGKSIDRNFVSDFGAVVSDPTFEGPEKRSQLNAVICEHFLRQGMLDTAEQLIRDANFSLEKTQKEPFLELHRILEALKKRDLFPALRWAELNREKLKQQNSLLEFKLHRLLFISLISHGIEKQSEALNYARNFGPFAQSHSKELQILMGSLLYLKQGIHNSPYSHLLDPIHWADICDIFTRDACSLLGLSVESPLAVSIRAGCMALPPLLNIKQVMQQRQCSGVWSAKDELPVEIDLGSECRYHSVFACPILRQQSTENNPPVRLLCGHVISRDALNKLANGNKLKCPYCPVEQSPASARTIYF